MLIPSIKQKVKSQKPRLVRTFKKNRTEIKKKLLRSERKESRKGKSKQNCCK